MNAWRIDGARIRQTTKEGGSARPAPPVPALAALLARSDIDLVGAATTAGTAETLVRSTSRTCSCWRSTCRKGSTALGIISGGRDRFRRTVIVLSGNEDRCVIDAAARLRRVRVRPEVGGTGGDRHGDPSGLRAVCLPGAAAGQATAPAPDSDLLHKLTRRELEILELVSGGRSNRQVAEILWVADDDG